MCIANENDGYPEDFYRGVTTERDNLTDEGFVAIGVFKFDEYNPQSRGDDGFCELSISWNDDENAIVLLREQRKPFTQDRQFKAGYCKVNMFMVRRLRNSYEGYFDYERKRIEADEEKDIPANPYHGNLLLHRNASKKLRNLIQNSLAAYAVKIHTWEEQPQMN